MSRSAFASNVPVTTIMSQSVENVEILVHWNSLLIVIPLLQVIIDFYVIITVFYCSNFTEIIFWNVFNISCLSIATIISISIYSLVWNNLLSQLFIFHLFILINFNNIQTTLNNSNSTNIKHHKNNFLLLLYNFR